jgi:hypothetical protein
MNIRSVVPALALEFASEAQACRANPPIGDPAGASARDMSGVDV